MRRLIIASLFLITPILAFSATYVNKTSTPLVISKKSVCASDDQTTNCVCVENESCTKTESIQLLERESAIFENDQDQPVTIMSSALHEKREFFPTNSSFNYDITVAKYSPKFSRITINHAQ